MFSIKSKNIRHLNKVFFVAKNREKYYIHKTMTQETPIAGIFIPTMNRVDFVIRQLRYYASVKCPHTIYVGDSSPQEESEKIHNEIKNLGHSIKANYYYLPGYDSWQSHYYLIAQVKEKYICYSGDDDYQIPDSVTKCIEFLEAHPDYTSASGHAVSFRLKQSGPYGSLKRLADYPRQQIEEETGSERIKQFFRTYFVTHFSINKTADLTSHWHSAADIKDRPFQAEILPTSLPLIYGKSKILNCLGFVRQIHDSRVIQPSTELDWIANPDWPQSYILFHQILSEKLAQKDGIALEEAKQIIKFAFIYYLAVHLQRNYESANPPKPKYSFLRPILRLARSTITKIFPFSRYIYRVHIKPKMSGKKEMHYEISRTGSSYYNDFKPVMDSFSLPS
ncbi:MAG: TIGR00180 family glycosyltransferase [bacterium]|nr:TIGR00180 family glycosyltransferase [bacterium]